MVMLLQHPAYAKALSALAAHYHNDVLADPVVTRKNGKAWFAVGIFKSEVATMPQPDRSLTFMSIDPAAAGFQFTRSDKDDIRNLVVRDGQHEYLVDEVRQGHRMWPVAFAKA